MAITYIMLTLSVACIPVLPNLALLYTCAALFGFGSAVFVCAFPIWLMEMWNSRARQWLQVNDCSFGIGSIMTTIILKPFLVGELADNNINNSPDQVVSGADRQSRLWLPVLIICLAILPIPISSVVMYFVRPYRAQDYQTLVTSKDINNDKEEEDNIRKSSQTAEDSSLDIPDTTTTTTTTTTTPTTIKLFDRPETPRPTIIIIFALWFTIYSIFETMFLKFAVTYYQYSPKHLSAPAAAEIQWISTAVYTTFRGLNAFIGLKVSVYWMLCYHYVLLAIGSVMFLVSLYYTAINNDSLLWAASLIIYWGFSAMFSGILAYAQQYMTLTDRTSTVFVMFRGVLTLATNYTIVAK
ncbi:uncharacterized protein LOC128956861 [Oppia nitens]|uniref:uncharacterized protein LOC128956861 n=1 Tax=Oppia nitens TaxID=1686743 RepID=UPI0023D99699|nr:uncharacterized protein LOC128956861 [Oppia nitens]